MTRKPDDKTPARTASRSSGLVVGGQGGPEEELLESGQEEVFSRTEVESGRIEHQAKAGGSSDAGGERKRPA
ncbi:MAG: hypothetical protein KKG14_09245 [Alphaproteobacteria bacterium]|nr:hypothetical protein [Alphaproteobacteria bacterium]MBU2418872.1 hypothetical protein [Alphaproteobacteria bacterium]